MPLPELFEAILLYLDSADILRCASVCKWTKNVIDNSIRVRLLLELWLSNQHECFGASERFVVAQRLEHLQRLRLGWFGGAVSRRELLPDVAFLRYCELRSGHMAIAARALIQSAEARPWKVIFGPCDKDFFDDASPRRSVDIHGLIVATDLSQGLIISTEQRGQVAINGPQLLHQQYAIRAVSTYTGGKHPEAPSMDMLFTLPLSTDRKSISIDLCGSLVLVVVKWLNNPLTPPGSATWSSNAFIRNWKDGSHIELQGGCKYTHAKFLNHSTVLAIRPCDRTPGDIVVLHSKGSDVFEISRIFKLPVGHGRLLDTDIRVCQNTGSRAAQSSSSSSSRPLLVCAETSTVVVFRLGMRATFPGPTAYTLLVNSTTFTEHSEFGHLLYGGESLQVQWNDWGPEKARLLGGGQLPGGLSTGMQPYGSRVAMIHADPNPWMAWGAASRNSSSKLRILDFNPISCKHQGITDDERTAGRHVCVREPTVINDKTIWDEPIATGLPYCYSELEEEFAVVKDVVMDSERIVVTEERGGGISKVRVLWI